MIFNGKVTVVDKEKGIVIVTNGEDIGISKCDKTDTFDESFGKKLALARYEQDYEKEAKLVAKKIKFQILDKKLVPIQLNPYGFWEYKDTVNSSKNPLVSTSPKNPLLELDKTYRIKTIDYLGDVDKKYTDFTYTGVTIDGDDVYFSSKEWGEIEIKDIAKIKVKKIKKES